MLAERYSTDARGYLELWVPEVLPLGRALISDMPLGPARRILDLGGGVGSLIPALREAAPKATVILGDRSPGMLALAEPGTPRVLLDGMRLPFAGSFDAVMAVFMLFHLPDPSTGLGEIRRILRPGGLLGVATWGEQGEREGIRIWCEELDAHRAPQDEVAIALHDRMDTEAKVAELLGSAGFNSVSQRTVLTEHPVTLKEFIRLRTQMGSTRRRLEAMEPGPRAACLESAIARVRTLDEREFVDEAQAILTVVRA